MRTVQMLLGVTILASIAAVMSLSSSSNHKIVRTLVSANEGNCTITKTKQAEISNLAASTVYKTTSTRTTHVDCSGCEHITFVTMGGHGPVSLDMAHFERHSLLGKRSKRIW